LKKLLIIILISFTLFILYQPVYADETAKQEEPWERFSLNLGGFITTINSDVRLGTAVGLDVDVEEALGLDSSLTVFRADALYRFGQTRRHRADFSYIAFHRSGSKITQQDIEINNVFIPAGSGIDSEFDNDIIQLKYSYSIIQDDRMDLGVGIGLYVMPIEFDLTNTSTGQKVADEDFIAPLPVFNLRGDFAITPKLFFKLSFDFFYLEIDNFTGIINDSRLAFEYNIWKHVGIGVAYDDFKVELDVKDDTYWPGIDFIGNFDIDYTGLLLYAKIYF